MGVEVVGNRRDRAAYRYEQLALVPGFDVAAVAVVVLGRIKARPAAGEPVGLVRLVIGAELELVVEVGDEFGAMLRDEFAVDHAFLDQPRGEQFADRRMLADRLVHQRLGERRLVALIVAEAAIAPHVDDDIALEMLEEIDRKLAGESHRLRIVAVDVEDRTLEAMDGESTRMHTS